MKFKPPSPPDGSHGKAALPAPRNLGDCKNKDGEQSY
jgi:hypothetical protein